MNNRLNDTFLKNSTVKQNGSITVKMILETRLKKNQRTACVVMSLFEIKLLFSACCFYSSSSVLLFCSMSFWRKLLCSSATSSTVALSLLNLSLIFLISSRLLCFNLCHQSLREVDVALSS